MFLETETNFLETKKLSSVTKLFEYLTNILIVTSAMCIHAYIMLTMNLIKKVVSRKFDSVSENKIHVSKNKIFLYKHLLVVL